MALGNFKRLGITPYIPLPLPLRCTNLLEAGPSVLEHRRALVTDGAVHRVASAGDAGSAPRRGAWTIPPRLAVQWVDVEVAVGGEVALGGERVRGAAGEGVTALQTQQVQVGLRERLQLDLGGGRTARLGALAARYPERLQEIL